MLGLDATISNIWDFRIIIATIHATTKQKMRLWNWTERTEGKCDGEVLGLGFNAQWKLLVALSWSKLRCDDPRERIVLSSVAAQWVFIILMIWCCSRPRWVFRFPGFVGGWWWVLYPSWRTTIVQQHMWMGGLSSQLWRMMGSPQRCCSGKDTLTPMTI